MKDATEIVVVMDKSGSMGAIRDDAIGGFNTFVEDQKKEAGEANLTLVFFDTTYSIPFSGKPIQGVEPLDANTYRPGGGTALLDAIGRAITETGKRLSDMDEADRPDKVICVVITDGEENSSREHNKDQIAEMVKHQEEKYGWAFIYLGANVDAMHEARAMGIMPQMAVNFAAGSIGTRSAYAGASRAVHSYRGGGRSGLVADTADADGWKSKVKN